MPISALSRYGHLTEGPEEAAAAAPDGLVSQRVRHKRGTSRLGEVIYLTPWCPNPLHPTGQTQWR